MTNKFNFFRSLSPENGSGMDRQRTDNGPMKQWKLFTMFVMLFALGIGQAWGADASLPFSYDGNGTGTLPDGLSVNGTGTYSNSPKIKFDGTGDYIIIQFSDTPDKLGYKIKANPASGQSATIGTFDVLESSNGTSYTSVKQYTNYGQTSAQTESNIQLSSASRYVKFIYTEKKTNGGNIAIGAISISKGTQASPATITLYDANGSTNVSNKNIGESFALPTTAAECTGKTFVGWSTSEIVTATNSKPTFKAKGESVTLVATNSFYALYATITSNTSSVEAFSKYSGTLSTGDYVFVYNNYVMGNTISSSRCTNGTTPTITNNTISSPAAAIVWTIGTTTSNNTTYYTLYNANVSKYLAKTSNNNQASLVTSVDNTGAMYSCSSNANSTTYDFVNAGNSRYLRNNGSNGWAMYSTSTGGALTLYKKGTIETTTYDTTLYTTSCCTPLGSINGSVNQTNPTTAVLSWDANANVSAWTIKYRTHGTENWTTFNGSISEANNRKSATITTTCDTKYDFEIITKTVSDGYCTVDTILNNNGDGFDAGKYTITINDMTGGNVTSSVASSCSGTNNVTLTVSANEGKEIDVLTVDGSNVTASIVNNQYTFSMPAKDIEVSATFKNQASPVITLSKDALAFNEQEISVESEGKTFKVNGVSLDANVTWALSGDNTSDFSVSPASPITKADALTDAGVELTVTFTPSSAGAKSATLTFSSTGAQDKAVSLTGTGVNLYTVTFNAGSGSCETESLKQSSNGASIELPSATAPTGKTFLGWTTANVTETATRPTTILAAGSSRTPAADETLYAVYSFMDGNEAEFVQVSALNGLAAGDRVVIVSNGTNEYTLATDNGSFKKDADPYEKDANNKISVSENKHIWVLGGTNTANVYTLTNAATSTTLGASALCTQSKDSKAVSLTATNNAWEFTESGTDFVIKNNGNNYSYLETASTGFCIYYQVSAPSGNALSNYYQMLIFKGTATVKYATSPKVVSSIAMKTAPTTTKYRVGDVFDATGSTLTATYTDATSETITEGFTYEVNNLSNGKLTASSTTVTYTYKGKTTTQTISAGTLSSIAITTAPTKVDYAEGESFEADGMAVKAVFTNGIENEGVAGFTYSNAALTSSDIKVTISYTYESETKTVDQTISVGTLSSIAISTAPTKTSYTELDAFDATGMVVTATYSNGYSKAVTGYTITPDPVTYPCTEVTITYGDKTATQAVTVAEAAKYTVHFWTNGTDNQKQVIQGNTLTDIPTPAAIANFTFMGWASAELEETATEPASYALSKTATSYTPTEDNKAFYAVYRRSEDTDLNGFTLYGSEKYIGSAGSESYFSSQTNASNAEVFFEEDAATEGEIYLYYYDSNGAKTYVSPNGDNTTFNKKASQNVSNTWTKAETNGSVSYSYTYTKSNEQKTRNLAYNSQNGRFSTYISANYTLTKTAATKTISTYVYSTSAVLPVMESIAITTPPTKTDYYEGDDFESTGMVVTATYTNKVRALKASEYTITPSESLEAGTTSVTIAAVADNNKTTSQAITVTAIELTSIEVTTPPTKTVYVVGENFDPTGMVVTAHFNDSRKDKVITTYSMTPSTSTALTSADTKITLSYTEGGVTKTVDQPIMANTQLSSIAVTTNPTKMSYIETETFDKAGMVVTATYADATTKNVTEFVTYDKTEVLAALNTLTEATAETITFSYTESGTTQTTTLDVTVNPYPRYTVTFDVKGTPTNVPEIAGQGGVTVPENPAGIGDYTFAGWSKSQRAVESADDPELLEFEQGKYYPESNETLYAVFTMDHEEEVAGMYLTAVVDANNTEKTIGYFSSNSLYPTNSSYSELAFWFKDGYLFYMNGTNKKYVYGVPNDTKLYEVGEAQKANANLWTKISNEDGSISLQIGSRYLAWNGNSYFRSYAENNYPYNKFTITTATEKITDEVPYYTTSPAADVTPTISFAETSKTITVVDENGDLNTCTNTLTTNSTGTVSYVSSDETVATVAANGKVTAKKVGTVTITANVAAVSGSWKAISESYSLTIERATASASFGTPATTIVYKDNTIALPATSEQAVTITYSSSNPDYATVDADGNVTGVATSWTQNNTRSVTIYAGWAETEYYNASTNSTRASQTVTVKNNAKTQTLSFVETDKDFASGQGDKSYTNTLNGAKTSVTYTSSNTAVAEVNASTGEVTVHTNANGSATITATAAAGNVVEDVITYAYAQAQATYTISIEFPRPEISVASGNIKAPTTVELIQEDALFILYTLDGSEPSYANSIGLEYTEPLTINETTTLKAIAISENEKVSQVATATYTKVIPELTDFSFAANDVIDAGTDMTITSTEGAKIEYTIYDDGLNEVRSETSSSNSVTFHIDEPGDYTITSKAIWDVENGFASAEDDRDIRITRAVYTNVVILAHYGENYYALNNETGTTTVDYVNGRVEIPSNATNKDIVWERVEREGVATFYNKNAAKYIMGGSNTNIGMNATAGNNTQWTLVENATQKYYSVNPNASTVRTFMYQNEVGIKNYAISNFGNSSYAQANVIEAEVIVKIAPTSETPVDINVSDMPDNSSVVVTNNATLTIDAEKDIDVITVEAGGAVVINTTNTDTEIANITVEDGGTVVVEDGKTVTVETLVINTSLGTISGDDDEDEGGTSGQITGNGSINATGDVYIQIELTQDVEASYGWYAFSVPFPVDAMNGVYFGDTKLQNEVGYAIMAFHESKYAAGDYAWKKYRDILEPGKLYLITVGDTDYKTLRFKKVAGEPIVASSTVSLDKSDGDNAGWNGVGNPNLQISRMDAFTYMQFLDHGANSFRVRQANKTNLMVGTAFMLQRNEATSEIVIKKGGNDGDDIIALAPARVPAAIEKTIFKAKLKNTTTGKTEDKLFFTAREDATNAYEAGRDVTKLSMGNAKNAQMTISAYGKQLCAADFPLVNDQAEYPLTITTPQAGSYAICTEEYNEADIYLTKDGAIVWNLSLSEFEVELSQGTTTEYGLLLINKAPHTATGISGTDAEAAGVQKVVINDHVYILRGGEMYDVTGKAVK